MVWNGRVWTRFTENASHAYISCSLSPHLVESIIKLSYQKETLIQKKIKTWLKYLIRHTLRTKVTIRFGAKKGCIWPVFVFFCEKGSLSTISEKKTEYNVILIMKMISEIFRFISSISFSLVLKSKQLWLDNDKNFCLNFDLNIVRIIQITEFTTFFKIYWITNLNFENIKSYVSLSHVSAAVQSTSSPC